MSRKGKNFELAYKWLYELDKNKYKITSPAYIYDKTEERTREVDVLIELKDQNNDIRRIAIECRDRGKKQDTMWIEQLKTKREDLELDFIIATTTNKFTTGAIKKARYHGIIIEEAQYLNKKIIDNISKEFMIDLLFIKFEVEELKFIVNGKIITYKNFISSIGLVEKCELLKILNTDLYCAMEPHHIIEQSKFDKDSFFNRFDNSYIIQNNDIFFNDNCPEIIKKLKISRVFITVKMIPYKTSLQLNKSLSVFDVEPKKNKKYCAFFGSDEEYVKIGYLDNNEIISEVKLKKRKYYRLVGANMKINTIFPKELDKRKINMEEFANNGVGEFDFRKIS